MPLLRPYAYLVMYDLNNPNGNYLPFLDELRRSFKWWHFLNTTWVVLRYEALVELQAKLTPLIYTQDRLLIMPAKGPTAGWLAAEAWTWLNENVPFEWGTKGMLPRPPKIELPPR